MPQNNDINLLNSYDLKESKKQLEKTKKSKEKDITDNHKLDKYSFDKLSKKEKWC